jgi:hypothetical protein
LITAQTEDSTISAQE